MPLRPSTMTPMAQYTLHEHTGLSLSDMPDNPLSAVREWVVAAREAGQLEPVAACLATADATGMPAARMVLVKQFGDDGVAFYTNHDSSKGQDLSANPRAALCFWWDRLQRQVRLAGPVQRMPQAEADHYFQSRPRGSRIGAWASQQSRPVGTRSELEARVAAVAEQFGEEDIPIPEFWGGYWLRPEHVEFWQGRDNRLHDRIHYRRLDPTRWTRERLEP
ncbi:MAG: pyridoxamine 5'-phosphate oxidase [Abyssibacter sp.]|jgi:pyridoxamine 5'-phosphate oxidase|uniref:pyridoxamine 5'-phosphate oxidase n=1 Tax=Abyssibacter sp. TaxID=2320200 RepID=UPI00321BFAA7